MIASDYAVISLVVVTLVALALIFRIKPADGRRHGWIYGSQSD